MASLPRQQRADLIAARQASPGWLEQLEETDLDRTGRHPALGEISVEAFMNTIYVHQLMHMRDLMHVPD